jgi:transcriptional regulator with XRE-family HTH domain
MDGFGEILKKIREDKGLKQEDLSKKTGLTQSAISQFEKGLRAPTPATVEKIAKALEVDKSSLFPQKNYEKNVLMRTVKGLTPIQVKEVTKFAEFLKSKDKGEE